MPVDFNSIINCVRAHIPKTIENGECKRASVLLPLVTHHAGIHLLLTKRTENVEHHKGQISFPGGMVDKSDSSAVHTALRELEEEIGIKESTVTVIGKLDDIQIPSGFVVTPVVGILDSLENIIINNEEVAEIILIPLEKFFDPELVHTESRVLNGTTRKVYFYDVWKEPVWGATAHIIYQFIEIIS